MHSKTGTLLAHLCNSFDFGSRSIVLRLCLYLVRVEVTSGVLAFVPQLSLHVHVEAVLAGLQSVDAAGDEDAAARLREALHHHQFAGHGAVVFGAGNQVNLERELGTVS